MAISSRMTGPALEHFLNGDIDFGADDIKMALHTSTFTPNYDTDEFQDNLGNETTGTAYVAGGATMTSEAVTLVLDGTATAHSTATAYDVGDIVRPSSANGYVYRCIAAGTSAGSAPTFPTVIGQDVDDGVTLVWENAGTLFVKLTSDDVTWSTASITARYAVIYVNGSNGTTDYVIVILDFGQDESTTLNDFNVNAHDDGWSQLFLN